MGTTSSMRTPTSFHQMTRLLINTGKEGKPLSFSSHTTNWVTEKNACRRPILNLLRDYKELDTLKNSIQKYFRTSIYRYKCLQPWNKKVEENIPKPYTGHIQSILERKMIYSNISRGPIEHPQHTHYVNIKSMKFNQYEILPLE